MALATGFPLEFFSFNPQINLPNYLFAYLLPQLGFLFFSPVSQAGTISADLYTSYMVSSIPSMVQTNAQSHAKLNRIAGFTDQQPIGITSAFTSVSPKTQIFFRPNKPTSQQIVKKPETVWMCIEDFRNGRGSGSLSQVSNLRIEQEFGIPESDQIIKKQSVQNNYFQSEQKNSGGSSKKDISLRRMETIHIDATGQPQSQQVSQNQTRKIVSDLDNWQSQLKQKQRNLSMSNLLFVGEVSNNQTPSLSKKNRINDPSINYQIIDSIMKPSNQDNQQITTLEISKKAEEQSTIDQNSRLNSAHSQSVNGANLSFNLASKSIHSPILRALPIANLSIRPVTLTSMKLKNAEDMKFKTLPRYIIDDENNVVMKSDEQLMAEYNNKIINQIFKEKLTKAVGVSFPENKAAYLDLVQEEMKQLQRRTINHFKSLSYLQGQSRESNQNVSSAQRGTSNPKYSQIHYKELYDELFEDKLIKKNIILEEEKKEIENSSGFIQQQEHKLLAELKQVTEDSKRIKEKLNELRVSLTTKVSQQKLNETQLKKVSDECERRIYNIEKLSSEFSPKTIVSNKRRVTTYFNSSSQFTDQIKDIREEKEVLCKEILNKINEIEKQALKISQIVEKLSGDQEIMKEKRRSAKFILKAHYIEELHRVCISNNSTSSLVPTILKLLKVKIDISFISFPEYLDQDSVNFLISTAKLELEKFHLKERLKELSPTYIAPPQGIPFNSVMAQITERRRSVLRDGYSQSNSATKNFDNQQLINEQQLDPQQIALQLQATKEIEQLIQKIREQINDLKKVETERILNTFFHNQIADQIVQKILKVLLGQTEGNQAFQELKKRKIKNQVFIQANKTFHFATAIHAHARSSLPRKGIQRQQPSSSVKSSSLHTDSSHNNSLQMPQFQPPQNLKKQIPLFHGIIPQSSKNSSFITEEKQNLFSKLHHSTSNPTYTKSSDDNSTIINGFLKSQQSKAIKSSISSLKKTPYLLNKQQLVVSFNDYHRMNSSQHQCR